MPSGPLPYAYSTLTPASATSFSAGASEPGLFGIGEDDHVALGDLVMMFAQHGAAVHVIVDDEAELAAALERHRQHVDALVGEQTADARKRAGTVGKTKVELSADHGLSLLRSG